MTKDPARRCQSAKEALWELRIDPLLAAASRGPSEAEAAAEAAAAAKRKRRLRFAAVAAVALWAVVFAVIFWPKHRGREAGPARPSRSTPS